MTPKPVPEVKDIYELEQDYKAALFAEHPVMLDLSEWLPSFRRSVRPVVPGELVFILGDTGTGKSCVCQTIARYARPLDVFLFEIELPGTLVFERFAAMVSSVSASEIERQYKNREARAYLGSLDHIYTCTESRLDVDGIRMVLDKCRTTTGEKPQVIIVDYIGLMSRVGAQSRYEAVSKAAEDFKVLAKETNTVVVAATQIRRKDDDGDSEICLHDSKDSGSIENSAGLLFGIWRDAVDKTCLYLKVLKNTKGQAGKVVKCNFDGAKMVITERALGIEGGWPEESPTQGEPTCLIGKR